MLCLLERGWSGVSDAPGSLCRWGWEGGGRRRRLGCRFHGRDDCHRRLCCWGVWRYQLEEGKQDRFRQKKMKRKNSQAEKGCPERRVRKGEEQKRCVGREKQVRCQFLWHPNGAAFSDGCLGGWNTILHLSHPYSLGSTIADTHTSNLSKHLYYKHKTPLFQISQSLSLSTLAFHHHWNTPFLGSYPSILASRSHLCSLSFVSPAPLNASPCFYALNRRLGLKPADLGPASLFCLNSSATCKAGRRQAGRLVENWEMWGKGVPGKHTILQGASEL